MVKALRRLGSWYSGELETDPGHEGLQTYTVGQPAFSQS